MLIIKALLLHIPFLIIRASTLKQILVKFTFLQCLKSCNMACVFPAVGFPLLFLIVLLCHITLFFSFSYTSHARIYLYRNKYNTSSACNGEMNNYAMVLTQGKIRGKWEAGGERKGWSINLNHGKIINNNNNNSNNNKVCWHYLSLWGDWSVVFWHYSKAEISLLCFWIILLRLWSVISLV